MGALRSEVYLSPFLPFTPVHQNKGIFWLSLVNQDLDFLHRKVPQIFEKVPNHLHITLQNNVALTKDISQFLWQEPLKIKVTANCFNHHIQAMRVELPEPFNSMCKNIHPHMTLSMVSGVKPVQSNEMLSSLHKEIPVNFSLLFVSEFFSF